ncbi:hypothetical protein O181_015692 [Austropuccinia psidii MF-1]|uniref:Uncharacterized protein n=1 Tax=Austropuccinia psidii MF-1 TaxID=1389203 RepID=A0A9Q3GR00_9BASI|nr:hypothetical protein [Austropuccinia psidii MF-1]
MAPISNGYFNFSSVHQGSHPEDLTSPKRKVSISLPMRPSSNHWLFSFTVFLQGNTDISFSRDIQEAFPKQFTKVQCSINPAWKPHSFQYSLNPSRPVFSLIHHGNSIQPSSFPNLQRYTLHQAANTATRAEYRPAVSLKESSSQHFTYTSLF